jgi:hypothetical protein
VAVGQLDDGLPALVGLPDDGEFVRGIDGQRPQQDGVDRAEDGAVRADRQRKRQDGGEREPGRLAQAADRVAKIVSPVITGSTRADPGVSRAFSRSPRTVHILRISSVSSSR